MARVLFLIVCSLASASFAQAPAADQPPPPGDYEEPHVTYVEEPAGIEEGVGPAQRQRTSPPVSAPPPPPAAQKPRISLLDARTDWIAAVELFVARNAVDGAWSVSDLKGNVWRLKLVKARSETVRERQPGQFAGLASFKTAAGRPHRLDVEFAVDLSGAEPAVTKYAVKKIDGRAR